MNNSAQIKEWISLTKVGKLYEEEKLAYGRKLAETKTRVIARNLLNIGRPIDEVVQTTGLSKEDVLKLNHDTDTTPSPADEHGNHA